MIEILSNGAPNLVQDLGRRGQLALGVSRGGAMDALALMHANALVGNAPDAAGIEISLFPFRVKFLAGMRFAVTGADCRVRLDERDSPPWWGRSAEAGGELVIDRPRRGARAYLALAGGIDVATVMGSRSTDLKGGFGGLDGRGLRRGDVLRLCPPRVQVTWKRGLGVVPKEVQPFWHELADGCVTVRVLPAAEYCAFTSAALDTFHRAEYTVTPDSNRVGYRLSGPTLALASRLELLSHGIVPGTVQVPPSGQPIVQLADANTCGGYPKIATVIEADLWKLAQAPIGARIRFALTDMDTAVAALRAARDRYAHVLDTLALMSARA